VRRAWGRRTPTDIPASSEATQDPRRMPAAEHSHADGPARVREQQLLPADELAERRGWWPRTRPACRPPQRASRSRAAVRRAASSACASVERALRWRRASDTVGASAPPWKSPTVRQRRKLCAPTRSVGCPAACSVAFTKRLNSGVGGDARRSHSHRPKIGRACEGTPCAYRREASSLRGVGQVRMASGPARPAGPGEDGAHLAPFQGQTQAWQWLHDARV
jgi:hypothetical protein